MALSIDMLTSKYLELTANLAFVRPVYDHVKYQSDMGMLKYEKVYSLYEAAPTPESPRILIRDDKGLIVGGRTSYPLRQLKLSPADMDPAEKAIYRKISRQWGMGGNKDESADMLKVILNERVYEPVYRIKSDMEMGTDLNWKEFIDKLMNFNSRKDARLVRFFKATLLRGVLMRYVAHGILSTNPSTGKSITGDTPVPVILDGEYKVLPIADVYDFHRNGASIAALAMYSRLNGCKVHDIRPSPADVLRFRHKGEVLVVRTRSGREIRATPDHSFLILDKNGKGRVKDFDFFPKLGGDLKVGDLLPLVHNFTVDSNKWSAIQRKEIRCVKLNDWYDFHLNGKIVHKNTIGFYGSEGYKLGFLLGMYVAEGVEGLIINTDKEILALVKRYLDELGISYTNYSENRSNGNSPGFRIVGMRHRGARRKSIRRWLQENCGEGARNKRVPAFVWSAPKEVRRGFLTGYLAGDGVFSPANPDIGFGTSSAILKDEIPLMLAEFGIGTTIAYKKASESWIGYIPRHYAINLRLFDVPGKITRSWRDASKKEVVEKVIRGHQRHSDLCPSRGDVIGDAIVGISREAYDGYVYDFSVDDAQNFMLANLICLHNSSFYDLAGIRLDKVSANSLIGYAKGKEEIYRGVIADQVYSIAIEQVEAQMFTNFFSYLLSFMESGKAQISTGGVQMQLEGTAPIIITANPVGYDVDRMDSFRVLVDKLSDNEIAMGRRLGLIIYGTDFDTVSKKGGLDELEWKKYFDFYRAVEERVTPILMNTVYSNQKFVEWMEQPIPGYNSGLLRTYNITDTQVHDFLEGHLAQGYRHLRGGAVAMAIVDNMDKLYELAEMNMKELPPQIEEKLLKDAERDLEDLVNINKGSISNMSVLLQKNEKMEQEIFDSMPAALQEVILGVKAFKEKTADIPITMPLKAIETFLPRTKYQDIQKLESTLMDSHQIYRALLKNHFGFHLQAAGNELIVAFTDAKMNITVHA